MRVGFTEWSTRASTKERPFIDMFHVMAPTSSTDDGATDFSVVFRRNSGWQHSEETQVHTASLPPLCMHPAAVTAAAPTIYALRCCRCHCDSPLPVRLRMHCCNSCHQVVLGKLQLKDGILKPKKVHGANSGKDGQWLHVLCEGEDPRSVWHSHKLWIYVQTLINVEKERGEGQYELVNSVVDMTNGKRIVLVPPERTASQVSTFSSLSDARHS